MAPKYTILKAIIQNLSKADKTSKGFTLIELIVGLAIMLIVGGLALNAFVQASTSFNKDKRSIDTSQNLSAVLEMIGTDIRQAGEQINDEKFPAIKIEANSDAGNMAGSSKITVRRGLTTPLTLCEDIAVNQTFATGTKLAVAHNLKATVSSSANCDIGTQSSPLSIYRVPIAVSPATTPATFNPTTYYPKTPATALPTTPAPLTLKLPLALRELRDYRCNTDQNVDYKSAANAGVDTFCASIPDAKLRIAVSNKNGQILIFNQTDEVAATTSDTVVNDDATNTTTSAKKYQITLGKSSPAIPHVPTDAVANNTTNIAIPYKVSTPATTIAYPIGSPIYAIEERVYRLNSDQTLQMQINGGGWETLIKGVEKFNVSARVYGNKDTKEPDTINAATPAVAPNMLPVSRRCESTKPYYICQFNTTSVDDWKTIQGIKVELQARYDSRGQSATATAADLEKLSAVGEFFPRNVLSK